MIVRGILMNRKLLGITIIAFVVGLGLGLAIGFAAKIHRFLVDYDALNNDYTQLQANYTWLKQHSFTYYTVGDTINISNLEITEREYFWETVYDIKGTITNIGDKPIEIVYVYLILKNPDGTCEFETYRYEKIENLYTGETASFEFSGIDYEEEQTVEIWLIY